MNVMDAAHATGQDYPGGARALAVRLGMRGDLLAHKLNPNCTEHALRLDEAMRIQSLTGDHRIIQAMGAELGYVLVPMPSNLGDDDIAQAVLDACGEIGAYMREVADDWKDKVITANERRRLESAMVKALARLQHLQSMLSARAPG